jgi:hypothetical protein
MARNGEDLFRSKGSRCWYFKYRRLDGKYHEQSTEREKGEARISRDEELAPLSSGPDPERGEGLDA